MCGRCGRWAFVSAVSGVARRGAVVGRLFGVCGRVAMWGRLSARLARPVTVCAILEGVTWAECVHVRLHVGRAGDQRIGFHGVR